MAKEKTTAEFIDELREAVAIDRTELDEMWVQQPQQFQKIAERLALAISYRDAAKEELKDLEAELDAQIREADAERVNEDGGKKMTETAIKNAIREKKPWQRVNERLAALNKDVSLLGALKETYMMRRYALQDLVALHISGYSMTSSSKPARDRGHEVTRQRMNDKRKASREED